MKNMKTKSYLKGLTKLVLVTAFGFLGCLQAYSATITGLYSPIVKWNGDDPVVQKIGEYYQFDLNGFRGELVLETDEVPLDLATETDVKYWILDGTDPSGEVEKGIKIQTNEALTGKYCASYNKVDNKIYFAAGPCGGVATVTPTTVCKGGTATFSVSESATGAKIEWGILSGADLKDTTWLSDYDNQESFDYEVNEETNVVLRYTTSSGLVSVTSTTAKISLAACGETITSTQTEICPGAEVTFTSSYKSGTSYEWRLTSGKVVETTTTPSLTFRPVTTNYELYVDGLYAGSISLKMNGCGFYITPLIPITTCLQEPNYLYAVGDEMIADAKNAVFTWESSIDGETWTVIEGQNNFRIAVLPTEDTYYRAKYQDAYTAPFLYALPNCEDNDRCSGLQTRVLFYETFGFFLNENTYVTGKDIYINDIQLSGGIVSKSSSETRGYAGNYSGDPSAADYIDRIHYPYIPFGSDAEKKNGITGQGYYNKDEKYSDNYKLYKVEEGVTTYHIQKFVAPDPTGNVVSASEFTKLDGSSNQFVGLDGHLFLQANPMLPRYFSWNRGADMDDAAFRLQDGYYAIVANPDSVDRHLHQDYADISDATGNVNGAMLMVNSGKTDVSKSAIYAQRVELGCAADRFAFSMNVRNAALKDGLNPVNISVMLLEDISEELPVEYKRMGTIEPGHILNKDIESDNLPSGSSAQWKKVDKYVELQPGKKVHSLWVVLYNNGQSGDGNDMVLDDISFSVCLPKAELSANIDGEMITGEVTVCDGRDVELVAQQKGDYIPDPVYLFQYYDKETSSWEDMKDYSDDATYKETSTLITVTNPKYLGDVDYRVIIGSNIAGLREVSENPDDVCNEFLVARSNIDVRNTYGGPMCADETHKEVCFVAGDTVAIMGCRNLTNPNHAWKMLWKNDLNDVLVDTLAVKGVSSDSIRFVIDKNFNVTVYDRNWNKTFETDSAGMANLSFVAVDEGGCEHAQIFNLKAKHVVNLDFNKESTIGCDSVLVQIISDVPNVPLRWDWGVPGREVIINDTARVFYPEGLDKVGYIASTLKISVINDGDQYCAPAEPMEVPYKVNNVSYDIKVTASSNPVCVTPGQADDAILLQLTAVVTPEAAISDVIKGYNWRMDFGAGDVVDTTTDINHLFLTYKDLKDRTGRAVNVYLLSTNTVDCGTITNKKAEEPTSIDIREGQFRLSLEAVNPLVCLNSTDTVYLNAGISPKEVLTSIDKLVLRDGVDSFLNIPTNLTDTIYSVALTKEQYPQFFKAGTTKYFTLSAFDSYCQANNISSPTEVKLNGYEFSLSDPDGDGTECLTKGEKLEIKATLSDPNAANLITSYLWYKQGELVHSGGLTYAFEVNESSNDYYKLVLKDDICADASDSIQVAVSIKYDVEVKANKLSTCQSDDSAMVHAIVTPASSALQIKKYEWHAVVDGVDKVILDGGSADSVLVIKSETFPELVAAGVTADIYVVAIDSICDPAKSNNSLEFRFNVPYTMTVNYDGHSVCVPSSDNVDPLEVLLTVYVDVDPEAAMKQIGNFLWYVKGSNETNWNVYETQNHNYVKLTYSDLKKYKGQNVDVYVKSFDNICTTGDDPAISDTINVEIRVGGFDVHLNDIPTAYCVESLEDAKFTMKAVVDPADARNNVSEFYWYDNGKHFATTTADSIVLDKNTYADVFKAGYTANFSVAAFDYACEKDTVKSNSSTKVEFNTRFELSLDYPSDKICLPADDQAVTLIAQTTPTDAINHIKKYVWKRILPSELTTSTDVNKLNLNNTNWLEPSDKMAFKVTAYDNVCYNEADGGADFMDTLMVNKSFTPNLSVDYKYICSTNGSITSHLTINPSDAYVHTYKYKYIFRGVEHTIDVDSVALYNARLLSDYFPTDMKSGEKFDLFIEIDDSHVCGPVESDKISVSVQNPFTLSLAIDRDSVCVNAPVNVNVVNINPAEAEGFIKKIEWFDNEVPVNTNNALSKVYSTTNLTVGTHKFHVVATDSICPSVTSQALDVKILDSIRVKMTPDMYNYCYANNQKVVLHTQVATGSPNYYEIIDVATGKLLYAVPSKVKDLYWEVLPTDKSTTFTAMIYDGVCSYDKATSALSSVALTVHVPVEFTLDIPEDKKEVCVGDAIELSLSPVKGSPSYYLVYGKTNETVQRVLPTGEKTVITDVAKEGGYLNYTVVAVDEICPSTTESEGSVFVHEKPEVQIYANKENVIIGGDIILYADPVKGSPSTYEWFCDGVSFAVTSSNQVSYLPESTSEYSVRASDGFCPSATSSLSLDVKLPTAFTPYVVDGYNDLFMHGFNVVVFDRYGQKVFEGDNGWDGRRTNSQSFVDPGIYFYKVVMKNGKVEKGTVEVVLNK